MVALPTYIISLIALWWVIEPMDDDDGARIDVQPGGLVLTILLVIITLTFSRLYMYADARLVAAEEDEQSQRLVELLAAQQLRSNTAPRCSESSSACNRKLRMSAPKDRR